MRNFGELNIRDAVCKRRNCLPGFLNRDFLWRSIGIVSFESTPHSWQPPWFAVRGDYSDRIRLSTATMNHEHRHAEHRPYACADSAASSPDAEAHLSSDEAGGMHQAPRHDTAWDDWKSVRDVG
ncbi:hypothetical protein WKW77_32615 [Variovorax ureilyticus]|uniref:Uncharacterized protein n=1 Tax=Variovorax ureilyticus TaxID=1836198 RepID=A0ABU8VQH7_9BURK